MTSSCSLRTVTDLKPGDHLCYLYETNEEHRALLTPFLRQGLKQGEKVFCIIDVRTAKSILDYLRDDGLEIEPYLERRQLNILTVDETYLRDSRFNPEEMIALLRTKTEQALMEGYTALRIAGEMTWALRGLPGSDRLIEYEAKLNTFFPNSKCLAICLYTQRRFDPVMLSDVLTTHPTVIINKEVYDNFYYNPSTEFLGNNITMETLRHRLENLAEHKHTEEVLKRTKEEIEHRVAQQIAELKQANEQLRREIPKRKRAEEALQAERDKVQQYLDVVGVILVAINEKRMVTLINKKGCEVLGYQEQEILSKDWFATFIPKRIREEVKSVFQKLIAGELEPVEYFENSVLTKNGEERIIAWHNTLLTDKEGKIIGTLSSGEDITERKQAEDVLAQARDHLVEQVAEKTRHLLEEKNRVETIIETIPEGILVLDVAGTLSLANKTVKECYWNLFHEELPIGYNCLKRADNIFLETVKQLFLAQKEEAITIELKPNLYLQFLSAVTSVPGEAPIGAIIEVRDISPFIKFDNLRKRFVSMVSHELRTPISAIVQSTSNLEKYKEKLSEAQQNQLLDIISRNATLMTQLIEDLLLTSRIDEHRISIEWKRYRPLETLQNVLTELESRWKAKVITIKVDVDEEIELVGDTKQIGQIFRIILDNALKYSDKQATIKIEAKDHYKGPYNPQARDGVLIHFHDSGRGIRKKDLPYLFDRFFRSEDVREIPGTGLGLAIAQELTVLHQGEIFVESEFGKGSTFSVFLPRLTKSLKATQEERARS